MLNVPTPRFVSGPRRIKPDNTFRVVDLTRLLLPEQAHWSDRDEDEEDRKRRDVLEPRPKQHDGKRLSEAQQNSPDKGAPRISEPADDRGDEAADRERHSNVERGKLRWNFGNRTPVELTNLLTAVRVGPSDL